MDVVVGHKNIQDVLDEIDKLAANENGALAHVDHFSFVLALNHNQNDLHQTAQRTKYVLEQVHLHALRVVLDCCLLADDLQLPQEDSVVEEEEHNCEEMLQYDQHLKNVLWKTLFSFGEFSNEFANGSGMLQRPEEAHNLSGFSHL